MKMTPGKYLFIVSIVYMILGLTNIFIIKFADIEIIQLVFILVLCLPLTFKPIAKWVGMTTFFSKIK